MPLTYAGKNNDDGYKMVVVMMVDVLSAMHLLCKVQMRDVKYLEVSVWMWNFYIHWFDYIYWVNSNDDNALILNIIEEFRLDSWHQ